MRKVGIFDSGKGGKSVEKRVKESFPELEIRYFGDYENAPYGDKNVFEIRKLARKGINSLSGAELVIVACNTVSAVVDLKSFDFPVVGMIEAGKRTIEKAGVGVGMWATTATIRSGVYGNLPARSCGEVVRLMEENESPQKIKMAIKELAEGFGVQKIFLGCTHLPLIQEEIQEVMGEKIELLDPGDELIKQITPILRSG